MEKYFQFLELQIFLILLSGSDWPFKVTGGSMLDSCLSGVNLVTDDFPVDARHSVLYEPMS